MIMLTLSQTVEGYLLDAHARRLSADTIRNYTLAFRRFQEWLGSDPPLATITSQQVARFMVSLAEPRERAGIAPQPAAGLSKKTALNYHGALGALWTWAVGEGVVAQHVVHDVPRPRPEQRTIQPFTEADCRALVDACGRTRRYERPGKAVCDNERRTADRDRALMLLMLDTGMRAGELAGLRVRDVDLKNRRLIVLGKGCKERQLPFGPLTAKAIWRYLQTTRGEHSPADALFVTVDDAPLSREALLQLVKNLGDKCGVSDCHPHRFRHTFAITFLRNGGNVYELQALLGHTTLEMVRHYVALAQTDVEAAHKRASPVEGWRLGR